MIEHMSVDNEVKEKLKQQVIDQNEDNIEMFALDYGDSSTLQLLDQQNINESYEFQKSHKKSFINDSAVKLTNFPEDMSPKNNQISKYKKKK